MAPPMSFTVVEDVSVEIIQKRKRPRKHYVFLINVRWQDSGEIPVYRNYSSVLKLQDKLMRIKDFLTNMKDAKGRTKTGAKLRGESFFARFTLRKKSQAQRRLLPVDGFLKSVVRLPTYISQSDPVINFFRPLDVDLKAPENTVRTNSNDDQEVIKYKDDEHSSNPKLLEQYVAISDYTKKEEKDLDLKAGEAVDVIEKNEHGWWFVDLEGALGWVPASLLEPRDGSADDVVMETFVEGEEETYITVETYEAKEEGEIGFSVGCLVKVTQKNVDGWWHIRVDGEEGWAPAMYLNEVCTSSGERRQTSIRRMNRGGLRNSISHVAGRRNTKGPPPKRKPAGLKDDSLLQHSHAGVNDGSRSAAEDAVAPIRRDAKLDQETRNDVHATPLPCGQPVETSDVNANFVTHNDVDATPLPCGQPVEPSDVNANVVLLEQVKERNGLEKSAGKDELVMFEHGRRNDFNEATSVRESDSSIPGNSCRPDDCSGPESHVHENSETPNTSSNTITDPTPLNFSCDPCNSEIDSDGSLSEEALFAESPSVRRLSWDESSDQEVFLEGPLLTNENMHPTSAMADLHVAPAGSPQKTIEFGVNRRKASLVEELKESNDNSRLVQQEASSERESFDGLDAISAGDGLGNPLVIKAVQSNMRYSPTTTEDELTDQESALGTSVKNRCHVIQDNYIQRLEVEGSCGANEKDGLRGAEIDCIDMTDGVQVKVPSLAVAEDLDDLDDFMD